jgi:hypothetical protein
MLSYWPNSIKERLFFLLFIFSYFAGFWFHFLLFAQSAEVFCLPVELSDRARFAEAACRALAFFHVERYASATPAAYMLYSDLLSHCRCSFCHNYPLSYLFYFFSFVSTALTMPCCDGLLVTRASPSSVSMVVPFVIMPRRTKCGFAGFSITSTIIFNLSELKALLNV